MTIPIIDDSPKKIAQALDDKSLSKMIKSVARVLCGVHAYILWNNNYKNCYQIPLKITEEILSQKWFDDWEGWASLCIQNYRYLVELGVTLCGEWSYRNKKEMDKEFVRHPNHKLWHVIKWAQENEPDLPFHTDYHHENLYTPIVTTPFPLVMPKKYLIEVKGDPFKLKKEFVVNDIEMHCCLDVIESYRNYYKHILEKRANKKCDAKELIEINELSHIHEHAYVRKVLACE